MCVRCQRDSKYTEEEDGGSNMFVNGNVSHQTATYLGCMTKYVSILDVEVVQLI